MSLVAYGSSDESSDEEVNPDTNPRQQNVTSQKQQNVTKETQYKVTNKNASSGETVAKIAVPHSKSHMNLPIPKYEQNSEKFDEIEETNGKEVNKCKIEFGALPKPQRSLYSKENVVEDDDSSLLKPKQFDADRTCDYVADDDIPLLKPKQFVAEKVAKQNRAPARISVPSLSDFKDVDEDLEKSKTRRQPSKQGIGLFAILPAPQSETSTKKNNFIPHVLTKTAVNTAPKKPATVTKVPVKIAIEVKNPLTTLDYDSNSDDDEEGSEKGDFFSLSKPVTVPEASISAGLNFFSIPEDKNNEDSMTGKEKNIATSLAIEDPEVPETMEIDQTQIPEKTLVSTVMNMPREEILLKNKAEVGPKLPVPEQEFNVDSEGNVAFDDKAIEYLCGKRGVKRRNQMIDEANIIEINGEDIKPDEREWLVKALTEEPVQRPISMQSGGPSSQSKKKHQITYLAHQAKANEVELKNRWSQNRMTRKQTQSKYGF